ncbi:MAG: hypothetical protein CL699_02585 [Chloroflexi bacterium]|nr:hypothetical protein [Chloroflexota bacterium]
MFRIILILSLTIVFVACGSAVGRGTGFDQSKSSSSLAVPSFSGSEQDLDEDFVRQIVAQELKMTLPLMLDDIDSSVQEKLDEIDQILDSLDQRVQQRMNASDEAIQQRLDEIYRQVSLIEAQVNGTDYAQNPIATTRVNACLENVECLSTLESLESWVDAMNSNDLQIIFEFDQQTYEQIYLDFYNNWDLSIWDLHALPENFRYTILYLRRERIHPDRYEVECYKDEPRENQYWSCNNAIKELLYHYLPLAREDYGPGGGEWRYQERFLDLRNFLSNYTYYGFEPYGYSRPVLMDPNLGLSLSSEHKILLTEFEEITYLGLSDLILNLDEQMP